MESLIKKTCCFLTPCVQIHIQEQVRLAYQLYEEVYRAVGDGYDTFYFGGCSEIDITAAEQVLLRRVVIQKGDPKHIRLIAVMPYKQQANGLEPDLRQRYDFILGRCDETIVLQMYFTTGCLKECDRFMSDRCSRLIVVSDKILEDDNAFAYARCKDVKIVTIPVCR